VGTLTTSGSIAEIHLFQIHLSIFNTAFQATILPASKDVAETKAILFFNFKQPV
jgi:hypothetical protein